MLDAVTDVGAPRAAQEALREEGSASRRRSFRVPVFNDGRLRVDLTTVDGKRLHAKARDVSLLGTRIQLPADDQSELEVGTCLNLELGVGASSTRVTAVVVRRDRTSYGLFFPDALRDEEVEPPADLRAIVKTMETIWLQERVRLQLEAA